ncbi:hypothetical protein CTheo_5148 [Ceratobasidium theobromae]|uniref:Transmembrane protein n=1 Tax=Ceratobasidium theobromae TaxID=1582974 RepID=A0A5N5QIB1_9AGAM|nr:hypothetical protein CTheo_5148 [Ceratobasidium theobromae]
MGKTKFGTDKPSKINVDQAGQNHPGHLARLCELTFEILVFFLSWLFSAPTVAITEDSEKQQPWRGGRHALVEAAPPLPHPLHPHIDQDPIPPQPNNHRLTIAILVLIICISPAIYVFWSSIPRENAPAPGHSINSVFFVPCVDSAKNTLDVDTLADMLNLGFDVAKSCEANPV